MRLRYSRHLVLVLAAGLLVLAAAAAFVGRSDRVRVALGLAESCALCHRDGSGLDGPHAPERIGCAACHAGDVSAEGKDAAHSGMIRFPGNLGDAARSCGRAGCHEALVPRVQQSIMTTMAGVIAVNRAVLGDGDRDGGHDGDGGKLPDASRLGHGVADSHLRELCVGCHLGQAKTEWGPPTEDSWGGGCLACHLEYGAEALRQLRAYEAQAKDVPGAARAAPTAHPTLTVNPRNDHCFGCHSRSGRIALSYEGWHETGRKAGDASPIASDAAKTRQLADGRILERIVADVHHERGLECIDCHIATELMGTGTVVPGKAQQLRIGCEDCHAQVVASVPASLLDPESTTLLALRRWVVPPDQQVGTTRDGAPLVNVRIDGQGRATLLRKRTGQVLPLRPPAAACGADKAHARLSCATCHSAWAPRCVACHTTFDPADEGFDHAAQKWVPGTWNETSGVFEAALPTLGVTADAAARGAIDTFVPGMILSFDRNRTPGGKPDLVFRRLYARFAAHTTRREVRDCRSCHNDPVALGYGKGELRYVTGAGGGRWRFVPAARASPFDGLPEDAWTGFLQQRTGMVSTHAGARPFDVAEQRRILRVGACLTCHAGSTPVMQEALRDFGAVFTRRSAKCVVPPDR